jgi:hypothetical protein
MSWVSGAGVGVLPGGKVVRMLASLSWRSSKGLGAPTVMSAPLEGLGEGDHVADVADAAEDHHQAIEARPPAWMLELAESLILGRLPTGVIVGTAVVEKVTRGDSLYEWHLADVRRLKEFRKPTGHPQPTWFTAFKTP